MPRRCVSYSHASGKVLAGVVKFYREIFYKSRFFKHIKTAASEITKKQQSFLTRSQVAEHHCISYRIFSNFSCVLLLSSVLTFSVLFSPHFCRYEVKCYSISVKRVMLILLRLIFPDLERGISVNHKISAV